METFNALSLVDVSTHHSDVIDNWIVMMALMKQTVIWKIVEIKNRGRFQAIIGMLL